MSDWTDGLADVILEDRVDRGETRIGARARALRYARFLELLEQPHDPATCTGERAIRQWPGDLGFHTGQATVLVGAQGKGKTNAIAYLIQKALLHRPSWDIYTNIPFPWDEPGSPVPRPPRLFPVNSLSGLLRGICGSILNDRVPAVAVDEMDQASTSHEWATERSESWTKFLFVERHFRVRGPLVAYHVREHVPLPLRHKGDLRGSYFRLVVVHGARKLARVEDTSRWWGVRESALPFQTLGLRGFDLDVDVGELEAHLNGTSHKKVARQLLAALDHVDQARAAVEAEDPEGARARHIAAVARHHEHIAETEAARAERREEIIQAFVDNPELTRREAVAKFGASATYVSDLHRVAVKRRAHHAGAGAVRSPVSDTAEAAD